MQYSKSFSLVIAFILLAMPNLSHTENEKDCRVTDSN